MARILPLDHTHAEICGEIARLSDQDAWTAAAIVSFLPADGCFGRLSLADDGEPAGFGLFRLAADEAEILILAVRSEFRRQGHAGKLLAAGEQAAAERGVSAMFLEVAEDNFPARSLYLAAGYRQVGLRPGYYRKDGGKKVSALIFRKNVS